MRPQMTSAEAEILALKALTFLANSDRSLDRFMSLSGTDQNDLRTRTGDPEFLAAVMDFLLSDEALLTAFCEERLTNPKDLQAARQALPGA